MANKIQIIGGERDGQFMDWIGNRVSINGVDHVLQRVTYLYGQRKEYYVIDDGTIESAWLDVDAVKHIEVLG